MTATDIMMPAFNPAARTDRDDMALPVRLGLTGNHILMRLLGLVSGAALILTAIGLWIFAESGLDGEMVLIRMGLTAFCLLTGLSLILHGRVDSTPEAYFDPIRQELRILQKNGSGRPRMVLRRSYDSLGGAQVGARWVEIWDLDGSILMRMPVGSKEARLALRMQLGALIRQPG